VPLRLRSGGQEDPDVNIWGKEFQSKGTTKHRCMSEKETFG